MSSHIRSSAVRENCLFRRAETTDGYAALAEASRSWNTIALMMTSAAMFAHSSLASAPNTSEIRPNVPGADARRDPARLVPSSRRSTASSKLPGGGVARWIACPRSAGIPLCMGPEEPSARHSLHSNLADAMRSYNRACATERIKPGTVTAKTFCTFCPSISMPSRARASASTVGAGLISTSIITGPAGSRATMSGRRPPCSVSATASTPTSSRSSRANASLMMLS